MKISQISVIAMLLYSTEVAGKRNVLERIGSQTLKHPRVQGANQAYCEAAGSAAVKRLRGSPPDVSVIIAGSAVYVDDSFKGNAALYGDDATRFTTANNGYDLGVTALYVNDVTSGELNWQRAFRSGGNFPTGKIMGTDKWSANTNYYDTTWATPRINTALTNTFKDNNVVTAMSAVGEFPKIMGDIIRVQTNNAAGIYGFQFHIRGQPWHVVIDDQLLFKSNGAQPLLFHSQASVNNKILWGPLMEKAYAKVIGSYAAIANNARNPTNELRIFTGAPVMEYSAASYANTVQAKAIWDHFKTGETAKYVMTAQVYYKGDASAALTCGLKQGRNFVVIAAWEMTDSASKTWQMLLLRDPTGDGKVYNKDWKYNDSKWTTALRATVPYGIDPVASQYYDAGIFAVPLEQWLGTNSDCFEWGYIANVRNYESSSLAQGNFKVTKFDFDRYDNSNEWYERFGQATATVNVIMGAVKYGDWYLQVETYPYGMVPRLCTKYVNSATTYNAPNINYQVSQNGNVVSGWNVNYAQMQTKSLVRNLADYSTNQIYKATLGGIDFRNGATDKNVDYPLIGMDFTISVYHDKRNNIVLSQSDSAAGSLSANVDKPYSLFFNGKAPGETTADLNGFLNSGTTPTNPRFCTDNAAKTPTGCFETLSNPDKYYVAAGMEGVAVASSGGGGTITPTATGTKLPAVKTLEDCFIKSAGDAGLFFELFFANFFTVIWVWAWFNV